ncbi:hypothetical protein [Staphylococcus saprophyticus]|nr:hypothetical protein [Staphylococcus saprophyticus]
MGKMKCAIKGVNRTHTAEEGNICEKNEMGRGVKRGHSGLE